MTFCLKMETFTLGFPPEGHSVDPPSVTKRLPDSIREEVIRRFDTEYPSGYVLVGADSSTNALFFYTRTQEYWESIDEIDEVVLFPTLPGKGSGWILIGRDSEGRGWPDSFLGASRYSERLHDWMAKLGQRIAVMIDKPYREHPADCDA